MPKTLITDTLTLESFYEILKQNDGLVILKFGAEWCGPCKMIEKQVYEGYKQMPPNVQPIIVDVDESFEVYAFLKSKKMVKSIPTLLCYEKGNVSYVPNDVMVGADMNGIDNFFRTCFETATAMLQ
jgi:thioredoxin 1